MELNVCKEIPLNNSKLKTIVDDIYYNHLMDVSKWSLWDGYVYSTKGIYNKKRIYLHRYILHLENKLINNLQVDHIDRNPLNNTLNNLRIATCQENQRNKGKQKGATSKYIGVCWHKIALKWEASIKHNQQRYYIGIYDSEEEAAQAYDESLANIPIDEDRKQYNFPE